MLYYILSSFGWTSCFPDRSTLHSCHVLSCAYRLNYSYQVYTEDPVLGSHLTAKFVMGAQSGGNESSEYMQAAACCKHYAAYDLETIPVDRHHFSATVSVQRTLMRRTSRNKCTERCIPRARMIRSDTAYFFTGLHVTWHLCVSYVPTFEQPYSGHIVRLSRDQNFC